MAANRIALSLAGSDPSGGGGMQADLKTFHRFGVYGTAVISLLTRVASLDAEFMAQQLLRDLPPQAVKTGALGSAAVIRAVARAAREHAFPLVVGCALLAVITAGLALAQALPDGIGSGKALCGGVSRVAQGLGGRNGPLDFWA